MLKNILRGGVIFTFLISISYAKINNFKFENGDVSVDIPSKWKAVRGLLGVPLTIYGPMVSKTRPVITVVPTENKVAPFNVKELEKNKNSYYEGRAKWAIKNKGKVIDYFPYEHQKWKGVDSVEKIGFSYELPKRGKFEEYSYWVTCKKRLYHYKTIVRSDQKPIYKNTINKIINTITCQER